LFSAVPRSLIFFSCWFSLFLFSLASITALCVQAPPLSLRYGTADRATTAAAKKRDLLLMSVLLLAIPGLLERRHFCFVTQDKFFRRMPPDVVSISICFAVGWRVFPRFFLLLLFSLAFFFTPAPPLLPFLALETRLSPLFLPYFSLSRCTFLWANRRRAPAARTIVRLFIKCFASSATSLPFFFFLLLPFCTRPKSDRFSSSDLRSSHLRSKRARPFRFTGFFSLNL